MADVFTKSRGKSISWFKSWRGHTDTYRSSMIVSWAYFISWTKENALKKYPDNRGLYSAYDMNKRSRDSLVGRATSYWLDDRGVGVRVPVGSTSFRPPLGSTQPPIQCVPGALSPGVKRPGREADHSPPASAKVKDMWMYTSTPQYILIC
jgi:hypothetical protein